MFGDECFAGIPFADYLQSTPIVIIYLPRFLRTKVTSVNDILNINEPVYIVRTKITPVNYTLKTNVVNLV